MAYYISLYTLIQRMLRIHAFDVYMASVLMTSLIRHYPQDIKNENNSQIRFYQSSIITCFCLHRRKTMSLLMHECTFYILTYATNLNGIQV